jgi:hypothetical protein
LGFVALECGWVVTEAGRQPWIIYGVMRTEEAVTPMHGLIVPFSRVFHRLYCAGRHRRVSPAATIFRNLMLELIVAIFILLSLIIYALLGGADFGGGMWSLLAFGPRARAQRDAIAEAIAPIWEANHVWLILIIVSALHRFPAGVRSHDDGAEHPDDGHVAGHRAARFNVHFPTIRRERKALFGGDGTQCSAWPVS